MALEIGFLGEEMHLQIRQGATFGPFLATMVNPDLSPINLAGCIVRGNIRKKALDAIIVASLVFIITDPSLGKYQFSMTDEATSALVCGESPNSSESKYVYDIELEDSSGSVHPLYYGNVIVFREVTRV